MNDTIILNTKREPVAIVSPEFPTAVGEFLHLFEGMFSANWPETLNKLKGGQYVRAKGTFFDSGAPAKVWPLHDMLMAAHSTLVDMMHEVEYNSPLQIQTTTALVNTIRQPFEYIDDGVDDGEPPF